jgi:hypothetical protein
LSGQINAGAIDKMKEDAQKVWVLNRADCETAARYLNISTPVIIYPVVVYLVLIRATLPPHADHLTRRWYSDQIFNTSGENFRLPDLADLLRVQLKLQSLFSLFIQVDRRYITASVTACFWPMQNPLFSFPMSCMYITNIGDEI